MTSNQLGKILALGGMGAGIAIMVNGASIAFHLPWGAGVLITLGLCLLVAIALHQLSQ